MSRPGAGGSSWSVGIYRRLLAVYPAAYRQRFEPEMLRTFAEAHRERSATRAGYARFWLREVRGVLKTAAVERWLRLRRWAAGSSGAPGGGFRSRRPADLFDRLRQDLGFGVRSLQRHPMFTLTAAIVLGLGVGATTAIFTVVDAVVLKALPYPEPDRIVQIRAQWNDLGPVPLHDPSSYRSYRDRNSTLEQVAAAMAWGRLYEEVDDRIESVRPVIVSAGFLPLLGVEPALGRALSPDDLHAPTWVALISHGFWLRRFGGEPGVLGSVLSLKQGNGGERTVTVVGVLPEDFRFPPMQFHDSFGLLSAAVYGGNRVAQTGSPDLFVTLDEEMNVEGWVFTALARLKENVTVDQAQADLTAISAGDKRSRGRVLEDGRGPIVTALPELINANYATPLYLLLAGSGLVLLIAYVNVANLLLARAVTRERELAVRCSLGAGRGRLFRQLLAESAILGVVGAFLGLPVAVWIARLLVSFVPGEIYRLGAATVDGRALAFLIVASVLLAVLFGCLPALRGARLDPARSLAGGYRGRASSRVGLLRVLGVSEVALALVMLTAGGLLVRTYRNLMTVEMGFEPSNVISFDVETYPAMFTKYAGLEKRDILRRQVAERLAALPGVEAVGVGTPPLSPGMAIQNFSLENQQYSAAVAGSGGLADQREAEPGYFRTLGIPLLAGRVFTEQDRELHLRAGIERSGIARDDQDTLPEWLQGNVEDLQRLRRSIELPVIVNETMARFFWGSAEAAIGEGFYWGAQGDPDLIDSGSYGSGEWDRRFGVPHRRTIVGVVGDVKTRGLDEDAGLQVYRISGGLSFQVRSGSDPGSVAELIRDEVHALDPSELSVVGLRTMDQAVAEAGAEQRFRMLLIGSSAGMGLVLVAIGLFGVMVYVVSRRTKEVGIRVSLGAEPRDIMLLVGKEGLLMTVVGGLIGLAGSVALTRLMSSLLFGVTPLDPWAFGAGLLLLIVVGSLACLAPTLRATRVDPVDVLRVD